MRHSPERQILLNFATTVIERIMGWQWHGRCGRVLRAQCLRGNVKEISHFRDLDVDGRTINTDPREMAGNVAGGSSIWHIDLRVPYSLEILSNRWATVSFLRESVSLLLIMLRQTKCLCSCVIHHTLPLDVKPYHGRESVLPTVIELLLWMRHLLLACSLALIKTWHFPSHLLPIHKPYLHSGYDTSR